MKSASPAPANHASGDALPGAPAARLVDWRGIDAHFCTEWDLLTQDPSEPSPFAECWYCLAGLEQFACQENIRLLCARDAQGGLCGVLPLHIDRHYGRLPLQHVANWRHANVFLGAPLVRRGKEADFWRAALDCLDRSEWARGLLHINGLVEGGALHRTLHAVAESQHRECDDVLCEERPFLAVQGSASEYLDHSLSSKRRSEYRRKRRKLEEGGNLAVRQLADPAELDSWIAAFLALEASGWKGRAGSALNCDQRTEAFFSGVLHEAAQRNRLQFLRMDLDGTPIAMQTTILAAPGGFGFKACFAEDFAKFSPGILLQLEALERFEQLGVDWIDSCAGADHPVASLWTGKRRIARTTLALSGWERKTIHALSRLAENCSQRLRGHAQLDASQ